MTWDDIKGFLGVAALVAGVLTLALVEVLRRKFASIGSVARLTERVAALEADSQVIDDDIDKSVHKAVGDMAALINKDFVQLRREIEQMTALVINNNDKIGDHGTRLQKVEDRMAVMERYGSQPSQQMAKQITEMDKKLDRLLDREGNR